MSASVRYIGLEELLADLRTLPEELRDDAQAIVEDGAQSAKSAIQAEYRARRVTGNLERGVKVEIRTAGPYTASAAVKSTAPHAYIFENGTQTRKTKLGYNRGPMPPGRVFVPVMARARRHVNEDLVKLVESKGLEVRGDV